MKIGLNISESGAVVPSGLGYNTEIDFVLRYVTEAFTFSSSRDIQAYITADGSNVSRATRQNTRHLNLSLLCQASDKDHGAVIVEYGTSRLNRMRAIKACAYLSKELGYPFSVGFSKAGSVEDKLLKPYKAFCWVFRPRFEHKFGYHTEKLSHSIINSVGYAYELQGIDIRCARGA